MTERFTPPLSGYRDRVYLVTRLFANMLTRAVPPFHAVAIRVPHCRKVPPHRSRSGVPTWRAAADP